jgi:hypothetical protein
MIGSRAWDDTSKSQIPGPSGVTDKSIRSFGRHGNARYWAAVPVNPVHLTVPALAELAAVKLIVCAVKFAVAVMPEPPEQVAPLPNGTGELTVTPAVGTATVPTLTVLPGFEPSVTPNANSAEYEAVPPLGVPVTTIGYVPSVAPDAAVNVSVAVGEVWLITFVLREPLTPDPLMIAPMLNVTVLPKVAGASEIV